MENTSVRCSSIYGSTCVRCNYIGKESKGHTKACSMPGGQAYV